MLCIRLTFQGLHPARPFVQTVVITKWPPEVGRPWRVFSGRVEKAGTQAARNPTGANEIATTRKARFAHAHLVASGTYTSAMEEVPAKKRKRLSLKRPEKDTLNSTTPGDDSEKPKKTLELKTSEKLRKLLNGLCECFILGKWHVMMLASIISVQTTFF